MKLHLTSNPSKKIHKGKVELEHISASSATSYLECGLRWQLSKVNKLTSPSSNQHFVFGTAYHSGLEPWWKTGKEDKFEQVWQKAKGYKVWKQPGTDWLGLFSKGQKMISLMKSVTRDKFDPKTSRVEEEDDIDLGFTILRVRKDLITEVKGFKVSVAGIQQKFDGLANLDIKTSGKPYDVMAAERSFQLKTYAVPSKGKETPGLFAYLVATKTYNPSIQVIGKEYDKSEVKTHLLNLRLIVEQIKAGKFIRREGDWCHWCEFRKMCYEEPGWQDAYYTKGK